MEPTVESGIAWEKRPAVAHAGIDMRMAVMSP